MQILRFSVLWILSSQILNILVSPLKMRNQIFTIQHISLRPYCPSSFWLLFHVRKRCELYKSENVAFCYKISFTTFRKCCKSTTSLLHYVGKKIFLLKILLWSGCTETSCLGNDLLIGCLKLEALTLRLFLQQVCIYGL